MQLTLEHPDYEFFLRGADGTCALVNERQLTRSFVIAPDRIIDDWPVWDARELRAEHLAAMLSLQPAVILLGTGANQVFPAVETLAAALSHGIGIELMTNAAAARTFNVLAGENRRVVAGLIFPPE